MMMMMMLMKYISGLMTTQFVTIDHNTTAGETARSSPHYIFQSKCIPLLVNTHFAMTPKINLEIAMIQLFPH